MNVIRPYLLLHGDEDKAARIQVSARRGMIPNIDMNCMFFLNTTVTFPNIAIVYLLICISRPYMSMNVSFFHFVGISRISCKQQKQKQDFCGTKGMVSSNFTNSPMMSGNVYVGEILTES